MGPVLERRCIRFGRFEVWPARRRLLRDGAVCPIGGRAFDLLLVLLQHRDRVVGVQELMRLVWPGLAVEANNVQVQVWALRRVLGQQAIVTVPRRGYRLVEPVVSVVPPEAARPLMPAWAAALPVARQPDGPLAGHAPAPGPADAGSAAHRRMPLRWNSRTV